MNSFDEANDEDIFFSLTEEQANLVSMMASIEIINGIKSGMKADDPYIASMERISEALKSGIDTHKFLFGTPT